MVFVLKHDEFDLLAGLLQRREHDFTLIERHYSVVLAVNQQNRHINGSNVVDRR